MKTVKRMRTVCLCGSARFKDKFPVVQKIESLKGKIVLPPLFGVDGLSREDLRNLQFGRIERADEVLILDFDGYIGTDTKTEIGYAHLIRKPVRYISKSCPLCADSGSVDLDHKQAPCPSCKENMHQLCANCGCSYGEHYVNECPNAETYFRRAEEKK